MLHSLSIFCLTLLLSMTAVSTNQDTLQSKTSIKTGMKTGNKLQGDDNKALWGELFGASRDSTCQGKKMKARAARAVLQEAQNKMGKKVVANKFSWIKRWGYGQSAYLFDYVDSVFQNEIVEAFSKIYNEAMNESNKDTDAYKDPFDLNKQVSQDNKHIRGNLNLKEINKNYDPAVYSASINAVQIHEVLKKWNWPIDSSKKDFAADFIQSYDINGDGRLNAREMILGAILHNKHSYGSGTCTNCLKELVGKFDAMFVFLDCSNAGYLSAEDLWNSLPKLNRPESNYNIFAISNSDNIRTSAINDFCIKNGVAKAGGVTKEEFRQGLLLGYWDRQTRRTTIVKDDSRNLKSLRWSDDGETDSAAFNYLKEKTLAEMISSHK